MNNTRPVSTINEGLRQTVNIPTLESAHQFSSSIGSPLNMNFNKADPVQEIEDESEFDADVIIQDCQMASGNIYNEANNPDMAKFVNNIQNHIKESHSKTEIMKKNASKIFGQMKDSYGNYMNTLVKGEDSGHFKGIKKRMDPTTKYRLQQQMQKYNLIQ